MNAGAPAPHTAITHSRIMVAIARNLHARAYVGRAGAAWRERRVMRGETAADQRRLLAVP